MHKFIKLAFYNCIKDGKNIDPACGSGHILVYAFDVLYEIYTEQGYLAAHIPELILKNNLFGLEIDDRAAQLAGFALMMKARSKDTNIFHKPVLPNIVSIRESNGLKQSLAYTYLDGQTKKMANELIAEYKNAKNYGSILKPQIDNLYVLADEIKALRDKDEVLIEHEDDSFAGLETLINQTKLLTTRYDVVITNPPYMYSRNMNVDLSKYLKDNYPDSKADLFAVFLERTIQMAKPNGMMGTINQHSWMFLPSYEKLRTKILTTQTIQSMLHLGPNAFDEVSGYVVQSVAFALRNAHIPEFNGEYHRLTEADSSEEKRIQFLRGGRCYIQKSNNFHSIPGSPIAYWASDSIRKVFTRAIPLGEIARPRHGMSTGRNTVFLRRWQEVELCNVAFGAPNLESFERSKVRWVPYNKGGSFRKWYGNDQHLIAYDSYSREQMGSYPGHRHDNRKYYFLPGITWSFISSSRFGARYTSRGFIFDVAGSSLFPEKEDLLYLMGFLCSNLSHTLLKHLNPTLNFQVGNIASLPIIAGKKHLGTINSIVHDCVSISKNDWDAFEESWDFQKHPLLVHKDGPLVEDAFKRWKVFAEEQFQKLKANEEELNRIFIEIYGLQDELIPEVADEDVTIRRADRERDIKSFISYAVGCMFGRYSLDVNGLAYAGGEFDPSKYQTFKPVEDNIFAVLDDQYFENDIVVRFVKFVEVVFGSESLERNLDYIAESIGKRKSETARGCIRRYFIREFYKDHVRTYKKRPIYWMFRSPSGTFNALIYLHRYARDTVGRIRTDYLLPLQERLASKESGLRQLLTTDLTQRDITRTNRRLEEIDRIMAELRDYHQEIHHLADKRIHLDLDDGVAVNYEKFGKALAKI